MKDVSQLRSSIISEYLPDEELNSLEDTQGQK